MEAVGQLEALKGTHMPHLNTETLGHQQQPDSAQRAIMEPFARPELGMKSSACHLTNHSQKH